MDNGSCSKYTQILSEEQAARGWSKVLEETKSLEKLFFSAPACQQAQQGQFMM